LLPKPFESKEWGELLCQTMFTKVSVLAMPSFSVFWQQTLQQWFTAKNFEPDTA
jgi:hypothetical protein